MSQPCIRLSRPGFADPGDGQEPRRGLSGRSSGLREADTALGEPISDLAWAGPADRLDLTENAQPAILATSIAILAALRERWAAEGLAHRPRRSCAGHSMGQYSALVAAGALDLGDGIRLVRERGRLMQASGQGRDGAMAALIGLDDARLPSWSTRPRATASSSSPTAMPRARSSSRASARPSRPARSSPSRFGAKRAIVLPVSVAAHSPLMAEAADGMREALTGIASTTRSPAPGQQATAARSRPPRPAGPSSSSISRPASTGSGQSSRMTAAGVSTFRRDRPGRVLTGLIKRIAPGGGGHRRPTIRSSLDRLLALATVPA
jgi:[acyl-carrier-protein] S-malonyltransferase